MRTFLCQMFPNDQRKTKKKTNQTNRQTIKSTDPDDPNLLRMQNQLSRCQSLPKPRFLQAPAIASPAQSLRAHPWETRGWAPPQCPTSHPVALKGPLPAPQHLSSKLCACVLAQSVCVCVHLCTPMHWDQWPFTVTGGQKRTTVLLPLLVSEQSLRALHSRVTRARGARQAELWEGQQKDPHCAPHSYTGMNHVIFTQWQVRWMGRAPRRWSPWQVFLKSNEIKFIC